jgi:hypothetical protein
MKLLDAGYVTCECVCVFEYHNALMDKYLF